MDLIMKPMLASKAKNLDVMDNSKYIAERKYDGERVIAYFEKLFYKNGESHYDITLIRRSGVDCTATYPEVVESLHDFFDAIHMNYPSNLLILDGEMCVFDKSKDEFQLLQKRVGLKDERKIKQRAVSLPATYMIFDILNDLNKPLWKRKEELTEIYYQAVDKIESAKYMNRDANSILSKFGLVDWSTDPRELFRFTFQDEGEGIILKDKESTYVPGARSKIWLKIKHVKEADIVVTEYETNNAGIKLIKRVHDKADQVELNLSEPITVQCSGRQSNDVRARIDQFGSVLVTVEYLEMTRDKRLRMPTFKKVVERRHLTKIAETFDDDGGYSMAVKVQSETGALKTLVLADNLRFTAGTSDKVYELKLEQDSNNKGYLTIAYGRFNGKLNTKTTEFELLEDAEKEYNKKLAQKTKKGYQEV